MSTPKRIANEYAGMAELADALDSGSNGRKAVQVQVLLPAPYWNASIDTMLAFLFFFVKIRLMQAFSALLQMRFVSLWEKSFVARKNSFIVLKKRLFNDIMQ